jgi:hypothetical protein
MVTVFDKIERDNLNKADRNAIALMIRNYRAELEKEFHWRRESGEASEGGEGNGKAG